MKFKFKLIMPFVACITTLALVSCDGGSGSNNVDAGDDDVIVLPNNPNEATVDTGNGADPDTDVSLEAQYADEVFKLINQERTSRGFSELTRDSTMDAQCSSHNIYMRGNATPGGSLQIDHDNAQARANVLFGLGFKSFAENTAAHRGYPSSSVASEFIEGWVQSPGHLENITGNYTTSGVAVAVDSRDGTVYATQIFGSK